MRLKTLLITLFVVTGIAVMFTTLSNVSGANASVTPIVRCSVPEGTQSVKWYCPKLSVEGNTYTYTARVYTKKRFPMSSLSNHTVKIFAEYQTPKLIYINVSDYGLYNNKVIAVKTYKKYRGTQNARLQITLNKTQAEAVSNGLARVEFYVENSWKFKDKINRPNKSDFKKETKKVSAQKTYDNTVTRVQSPFFQVKPQITSKFLSSAPSAVAIDEVLTSFCSIIPTLPCSPIWRVNIYEPEFYANGKPTVDVAVSISANSKWFKAITTLPNKKGELAIPVLKITKNTKYSVSGKTCGVETSSPTNVEGAKTFYVTGSQPVCTYTYSSVGLKSSGVADGVTEIDKIRHFYFEYGFKWGLPAASQVTHTINYVNEYPSWITTGHPVYFPWSEAMSPIHFAYAGVIPGNLGASNPDYVPDTNQLPHAYNQSLDTFYIQNLNKYRLLTDILLTSGLSDPYLTKIKNTVCQPWVYKGYSQTHTPTQNNILANKCGVDPTVFDGYLTVTAGINNPSPGFNTQCKLASISDKVYFDFLSDYNDRSWSTVSYLHSAETTLTNLHNGTLTPEDNVKAASLVLAHYLNVKNKPAGADELLTGANGTMLSLGAGFGFTGIGCYVQ